MRIPRIGSKWAHYKKGTIYQIVDIGIDASKHDDGVSFWYEDMKNPGMRYHRPMKEWDEIVTTASGVRTQRFTPVREDVENRGIISKLFRSKSRSRSSHKPTSRQI